MTLRERIQAETYRSERLKLSNAGWGDNELGHFLRWCAVEKHLKVQVTQFYSTTVDKGIPDDAELEGLYARWMIEKGDER